MSFKNIHNHIKITEESVQTLFVSIQLELEKLSLKSSLDNKLVVSVFRAKLQEIKIKIKQQEAYEILSQLLGIKNYNIALSKQVDFSSLFLQKNKDFGFSVESFNSGSGKSTLLDSEELLKLISHSKNDKIPTGIVALDKDFAGGLSRGELTTILGGINVEKSMIMVSLASSAIRSGLKVLHINLVGKREEVVIRYASNLSNVKYSELVSSKMTQDSSRNISLMKRKYSKNLMIKNMTGFGITIDDVYSVCKETYSEFSFDLVVVDSGQLLEAKNVDNHRQAMAKIFRGLDTISKVFNCAMLTATQVTRSSNYSTILRSEQVSEAFEIARVSSVILSLNATDEEITLGKMRLFLEKQRSGVKNKLYGLITDFSRSNLIAGTYDPYK